MDLKESNPTPIVPPKHVLIECLFPNCPFALKVAFENGKPQKSQEWTEARMKKHVYKR